MILFRHLFLSLLLIFSVNLKAESTQPDLIRIGLTPVMLNNRLQFLDDWKDYLEQTLKAPVQFVQRKSYQEIVDLIRAGNLDIAWICGFPYVENEDRLSLFVVPSYKQKPLYQSYLIVNADDTTTRSINDLKNKVFAYSDSSSNSGYLVPRHLLLKNGFNPNNFFRKTFFTWSHNDVIKAVGEHVAEGGAVDGYIWDTLQKINPELTQKTRIVWKSSDYGFPPLVVRKDLPMTKTKLLQQAFLEMSQNETGKKLLSRLNLDGFTHSKANLYDSIRRSVSETESMLKQHAN